MMATDSVAASGVIGPIFLPWKLNFMGCHMDGIGCWKPGSWVFIVRNSILIDWWDGRRRASLLFAGSGELRLDRGEVGKPLFWAAQWSLVSGLCAA